MPKYVYFCDDCSEEYEIVHGMKEAHEVCDLCGVEGSLERIPQLTKIVYKNNIGNKVKDAIEENKQILEKMKKDSLKGRNHE